MKMEAVDRAALSERLFKARVEGKSERALAKVYSLQLREVQNLIDEHCPRLDLGKRRRAHGVITEQLNSLIEFYLPLGLKGDLQAANFALKVITQQCIIGALEHAPRRELVDLNEAIEQHRRVSSTDKLRQALDRIRSEQPQEVVEAPVIEGQAVEVRARSH